MTGTEIQYTISIKNPSSHYFDITVQVKNVVSDRLRFSMPVWTPGSYLVREFGRNVLDFQAIDAVTGIRLATSKDSKSTWIVETSGSRKLLVRYKVYAQEYTVDTSYLDDLHAVINGGSVFMYVEGHENENILLSIDKKEDWKEISTGLESVTSEKSLPTFSAPDYDTLIDSPIEIGNQKVYSFLVGGVEHRVSIYSKRIFDHAALISDIKKIVESTVAVTGHIPYKRYTFLIDFTDEKYGGLEHLNSTHCMASFFKLEPPQEYKQLLSLFSHEFFHAWNVKRMRPEGLGPFNYSSETYTKSLWVAEGITSYYDDLLLRRAGIYTVSEYLDAFCSNVNLMVSLDGSKWQSAEEASFDAWVKHYRQNENSLNALCSYYTQGAIIGWMLDLEIIRRTKSAKKLDDVIRLVYERTYLNENRSYRDEEFRAACNEIAGADVTSEIYEARVRGRGKRSPDGKMCRWKDSFRQ
ncbi:MAG: peptidase M61, partial [Thaumarchaeota archaeon]|nr:peptidase M61 [Nitrososphaerota archaeon]